MMKETDIKTPLSECGDKKELFHREFTSILNTFLENSLNIPILLQGPRNSGKKTIASQIGAYLGKEPKIFNFGKTTINNKVYYNVEMLIEAFANSREHNDFIIIEDLDKMQVYDYIVLIRFFNKNYATKSDSHNFRIIILEDCGFCPTKTLSDGIKNKCKVIEVDKDPVIETIRQEELKNKTKEKVKKGIV